MVELKPQKDHYVDEDELSDEYCQLTNCRYCFDTPEGQEPEHGCEAREKFCDDNYELVLDFDAAYFLVKKQLEEAYKEIERLKEQIETINKNRDHAHTSYEKDVKELNDRIEKMQCCKNGE